MYCPIGGRFTGDQIVDRLQQRAGFRLLVDSPVVRIGLESRSKASFVDVLDRQTGGERRIEAQTIVVCGGAVESPKLLMASANTWWPDGLGNGGGALGRFLNNHFGMIGVGVGPNPQRLASQLDFVTTASRHFDTPEFQSQGKFICTTYADWPPVDRLMMEGRTTPEVLSGLGEELKVSVVCWGEEFPAAENRLMLGTSKDSLGLPTVSFRFTRPEGTGDKQRAIVTGILAMMGYPQPSWEPALVEMAHPMGTCRMSESAALGVVDRELRIHGLDNVYVCSSAVFPTAGAANPTLTIVALAHRLARHLVDSGALK
jgi:hypothetical protein